MISIDKNFYDVPDDLQGDNPQITTKVKQILNDLYHNKCAYCETKSQDGFDVHHYRPVKLYPWLEFEWSNLLPVCPDCNAAKADQFPIENKWIKEAPKDREEYLADSKTLIGEKPLLLHPEVDTAENHFYSENHFYFENKDTFGYMFGNTKRGSLNIEIFKLNRSELEKKRKKKYIEISLKLKENLEIEKKFTVIFLQDILHSSDDSNEYSFVIKQICENFDMFYINISNNTENKDRELIFDVDMYCREIFNYQYSLQPSRSLFGIFGIKIIKFQGIKKLEINNIPLKTRWIFITGDNGYGKTSILRALLLGLVGKSEFREAEIEENTRIELKTIPPIKRRYADGFRRLFKFNVLGSHYHTSYLKFIAAYGAKRTELSDRIISSVADNLYEKVDLLYDFETQLKDWMLFPEKNNEKIEILTSVLKIIVPSLSRIEIEIESSRVIYFEKSNTDEELNPVYFNQLAMGIRSIMAMVADIIFRLTDFNLENIKDNEVTNLEGIVLIDEFDNHLHPKWQRMLVEKLTEIFPKVQFIVSTHSPIPLLGAPKNSVVIKVDRTKEEGITAKVLDIDISELPPENILSSPIFDFQDVIPKSHQKGKRLRTEKGYNEVEFYKILEDKLQNIASESNIEYKKKK